MPSTDRGNPILSAALGVIAGAIATVGIFKSIPKLTGGNKKVRCIFPPTQG